MIDEMHKKYVGGVDRQKDRNKQIDEQNYRQLANRQIYIVRERKSYRDSDRVKERGEKKRKKEEKVKTKNN